MNRGILNDPDGSFSWRKTGTAICFLLFAFSVIYYLIANKGAELPLSYQALLGMVFTFYFTKNALSGVKLSSTNTTVDNTTK